MHPLLADHYDLSVFLRISPDLQRQRILAEKEEALRAQLRDLSAAPAISTDEAIPRLVALIKESGDWIEPSK